MLLKRSHAIDGPVGVFDDTEDRRRGNGKWIVAQHPSVMAIRLISF